MIQFLNNIWIALSSENPELLNFILIPFGFLEAYLLMTLFLVILDIKAYKSQKALYIFASTMLSLVSMHFIPNPINVLINYSLMFILIKLIFKLDWLKSFVALLSSIFIFVLISMVIQNFYISLFNVSSDIIMNIPIHRILYLTILYLTPLVICILIKKFRKVKFNLSILDNLDKKTITILITTLVLGFATLCLQLITSAYYSHIVPMIMNIFNLILFIAYLILNIYSITRIIKLATTRMDLESAEDYNKSLGFLYDKVKGFNHDFNNIISTLDGFIENNDLAGLKEYFKDVKEDCKITNSLSILNPNIINNPGIYSLLNNKYFKAANLGISFELDFFLDLNTLHINIYEFSRILGILLDNAIEASEKCENKLIKVSFIREDRNKRAILTIKNTYSNKDVSTEKIFDKGISNKKDHSGIGLWEVKNYLLKNKNLDLFTSKTNEFFTQELSIYDNYPPV